MLSLGCIGTALAEAPERSIRPQARSLELSAAPGASARPLPRPPTSAAAVALALPEVSARAPAALVPGLSPAAETTALAAQPVPARPAAAAPQVFPDGAAGSAKAEGGASLEQAMGKGPRAHAPQQVAPLAAPQPPRIAHDFPALPLPQALTAKNASRSAEVALPPLPLPLRADPVAPAMPVPVEQLAAASAWAETPGTALRPMQRVAGSATSAVPPAASVSEAPARAAAETPTAAAETPTPAAAPAPEAAAPAADQAPSTAQTPAAALAEIRPKARPNGLRFGTETPALAAVAPAGGLLAHHLRPMPRPQGLQRQTSRSALPPRETVAAQPENLQQTAALRPAPGTPRLTTPRGSVCGIPGLKGEIISPILGRVQGCGVANPVRITEVDGIRLSQPATIDCETARALHSWVKAGLRPAMGNSGGGITTIQIAGHYVCRSRNHRKGAKISEHGKGRAVDISGLVLANGQKLSILRDWRGAHGAKLKSAHRAACGIFGTTLGPGSDGMHEDHLHFDTARHRSGTYCR